MVRVVIGIILALAAVIFFASAPANQQGPFASILVGVVSGVGGGLLIYFGARYLRRKSMVINIALRMLREEQKIDMTKLGTEAEIGELELRKIIFNGQRSGLIPFKADII